MDTETNLLKFHTISLSKINPDYNGFEEDLWRLEHEKIDTLRAYMMSSYEIPYIYMPGNKSWGK